MKSALEIAMERANKMSGDSSNIALTEEQKQKISALRKEYEGKIAEREIMLEGEIKKISVSTPPEEAYQLVNLKKEELVRVRKELKDQLEIKVQNIKKKD